MDIFISAVKAYSVFNDDLVKKIADKPLIQIIIDVAKSLDGDNSIFIISDSDEVSLIAKRNKLGVIRPDYDAVEQGKKQKHFINNLIKKSSDGPVIFLSPYFPLLQVGHIKGALKEFIHSDCLILCPMKVPP